jgi:hypothetical protein
MKPINFSQSNKNLLKPEGMTDEECGSLPIYTDGGQCISLWQMTWKERLSALLFGKVWVYVLSGHTQPPIGFNVTREVFGKPDNDTTI